VADLHVDFGKFDMLMDVKRLHFFDQTPHARMSSALASTNGFRSVPAFAVGAVRGLSGHLWPFYSFSGYASFWKKADLKMVACWSYENFSWSGPQASRAAFRGLRSAVPYRKASVPEP
jgi:hypothetical protein